MDKKKHDLSKEDLKRLLELAAEEEKNIDALSDEELTQEEEALSEALKNRLASKVNDTSSPVDPAEIDASWAKLEAKMNPSGASPIDIHRKKKSKSFLRAPYMGGLLAAALALALIYLVPSSPEQPEGEINYKGQVKPEQLVCDHRLLYRDTKIRFSVPEKNKYARTEAFGF